MDTFQQTLKPDTDWQLRESNLELALINEVDCSNQAKKQHDEYRPILCKTCRHKITDYHFKIKKNGKHEHAFFNPHGIVFELGCFSRAPGCMVMGPSTTEFSWFKGCSWSYSLCDSCRTHLGWMFEGNNSVFFGLILNMLVFKE